MKIIMLSYQFILDKSIIKDIGNLENWPDIEHYYNEIIDYTNNNIDKIYTLSKLKSYWLIKKENLYIIHAINEYDVEISIGEFYITNLYDRNEI